MIGASDSNGKKYTKIRLIAKNREFASIFFFPRRTLFLPRYKIKWIIIYRFFCVYVYVYRFNKHKQLSFRLFKYCPYKWIRFLFNYQMTTHEISFHWNYTIFPITKKKKTSTTEQRAKVLVFFLDIKWVFMAKMVALSLNILLFEIHFSQLVFDYYVS